MLGTPVPDNILDLDKKQLHALHAGFDDEIAEIHEKKRRVRDIITAKDLQAGLASRAGFDTNLGLGPTPDSEGLLKELAARLGFKVTKEDK